MRECNSTKMVRGAFWSCTLPLGHESDHEAHCAIDNSDLALETWTYSKTDVRSKEFHK